MFSPFVSFFLSVYVSIDKLTLSLSPSFPPLLLFPPPTPLPRRLIGSIDHG